jgi:hypothetical protein
MCASALVLAAALLAPALGTLAGFIATPFLGAPLLALRAMSALPHASLSGRAAWIAVIAAQAAALAVVMAWRRRSDVRYPLYDEKF